MKILAKAQLIVPVPNPWEQQRQYRVCGMLLTWLSAQLFRHFLEQVRVPPSTPLFIATRIFGVLWQLWMRKARLSCFLQKLTWSYLTQCDSKRYPHHHKGLQRPRVATFVSPTRARNSLDSGCKVTAMWLHPKGRRVHDQAVSVLLTHSAPLEVLCQFFKWQNCEICI